MLYDVPGRTGRKIASATTIELARQHKNVVAMKDAVELSPDRQLQLPQRGRQLRIADLATLQRRQVDCPTSGRTHRPLAAAAAAGTTGCNEWPCCGTAFTCGMATVCRIRVMTVSAEISSASAS